MESHNSVDVILVKKNAAIAAAGHIELSNDLIYSILLELPVKSLLRYLTVSKHWREIITSPAFSKEYKQKHSSYDRICYLKHEFDLKQGDVYPYQLYTSGISQPEKLTSLRIPFPGHYCYFHSASYDGLISILCVSDDPLLSAFNQIILWNPTTNQTRYIPLPEGVRGLGDRIILGYDLNIQDYILILLATNLIFVTPSKSIAWRRIIQDIKPICTRDGSCVSFGSNIYWTREYRLCTYKQVLTLSLTTETLKNLPLPFEKRHKDNISLCRHNNTLYLYKALLSSGGFALSNINVWWYHKNNNNTDSTVEWQKAFTVLQRNCLNLRPLGFSNKGEFLMEADPRGGLKAYYTKNRQTVELKADEDSTVTIIQILEMNSFISP